MAADRKTSEARRRTGAFACVALIGVLGLTACVPAPKPAPLPPCDADALAAANFEAYPEPQGTFLVTNCVDVWAAGAVYPPNFAAPLEVLFKAKHGEWVAVDRGFGMCARQGVPADVVRQLGCVV